MNTNENSDTESDTKCEEEKQTPLSSSLPKRSRIDPNVASTSRYFLFMFIFIY